MDILNRQDKIATNNNESPITNFYSDKSILITGATGFIGKVLIEKLLYSCPEVRKIYLLIRGSKGKSPHDRMIDMINQKPFTVRLSKDFVLSKLVPIESDLAFRELGLSQENQKFLINEIAIVFHVAASVKFEAPIEVNMRHNVVATKELLEFACQFKQLASFVHVSTAYSNCQLLQIEECVYKMQVPEDPMTLKVTKQLLDNRPNTYTFTKAMAENVVNEYANRINVAIVRPSIVMSSIKEPTVGWVDTINGPVGLSILGALGILQKIKVNSEVVFDLIPVDIVTNALLSIAWAATERRGEFNLSSVIEREVPVVESGRKEIACENKENINKIGDGCFKNAADNKRRQAFQNGIADKRSKKEVVVEVMKKEEVGNRGGCTRDKNDSNNNATSKNFDGKVCVFNLTTGSENPCSFYHYFNTGRQEAYDKPSIRALRPLLHIPKQKGMNPIQYWIYKVFSHLFFAYVMDFLLSLLGQKKMVVKAVNKMHHANEMFDYFCSNQWNFRTDNVKQLRLLQTPIDRETYNCDVRQIDWDSYARLGWLGCRRYILKETDDSIGYAKRRYLVVCILYYTVKLVTLVLTSYLASLYIESQIVLWMLILPIAGLVYLL